MEVVGAKVRKLILRYRAGVGAYQLLFLVTSISIELLGGLWACPVTQYVEPAI